MLLHFLIKFFSIIIILAVCLWVFITVTAKPSNTHNWEAKHAMNAYITEEDYEKYTIHNFRNYDITNPQELQKAKDKKKEDLVGFSKKYYKQENFTLDDIEKLYIITPQNEHSKTFTPFLYFKLKNQKDFGITFSPRQEDQETVSFLSSISRKHELLVTISSPQFLAKDIYSQTGKEENVIALPLELSQPQKKELIELLANRTTDLKNNPEFYNYFSNNEHLELSKIFGKIFPNQIPSKKFSRTNITDILYGAKLMDKPTPIDIDNYVFNPYK